MKALGLEQTHRCWKTKTDSHGLDLQTRHQGFGDAAYSSWPSDIFQKPQIYPQIRHQGFRGQWNAHDLREQYGGVRTTRTDHAESWQRLRAFKTRLTRPLRRRLVLVRGRGHRVHWDTTLRACP